MILLHHNEVELSRKLLATKPENIEVIEGPGEYSISAYPSVVVDVPAYLEKRMTFNEAGEFLGIETIQISNHKEILRAPVSWEAVQNYIEFINDRAIK